MARTTEIDICEGLAANLNAAITGVQCNGYLLASPTAPGFEIEPGEIEYDLAMGRGLDRWTVIVRGYVSEISDIGGQNKLRKWRASSGSQSVKAAIQTDKTLGGVVSDLRVVRTSRYLRFGTNPVYLGAEWEVEVYGTGV